MKTKMICGRKVDCGTLTHPASLQLVSLWALARVTPRVVNTLILTHVAGQAAFIDVWVTYTNPGCSVCWDTNTYENTFI